MLQSKQSKTPAFAPTNRTALGALCALLLLAAGLAGQPSQQAHASDAAIADLLTALEAVDPAFAVALRRQIDDPFAKDLQHEADALDRHSLIRVVISPESRVKVDPGAADRDLIAGQWRTYLVRVENHARVTAPLAAASPQFDDGSPANESSVQGAAGSRWLELKMIDQPPLSPTLTGSEVEYRPIRLRTHVTGKRSAVIAMDVGEGTADIGFRNDVVLTFVSRDERPRDETAKAVGAVQARRPTSDVELRAWLENMVWHHRFRIDEVCSATGLNHGEVQAALKRFGISPLTRPHRGANEPLLLLPYPGGRHPRIGFLDGAVNPQRETKASVFLPWDPESYVVVDAPEAIWSNLGLIYLAHTHVPTLWDVQGVSLPQLEWRRTKDGGLECERALPNGISFGTRLTPTAQSLRMEMWLTNGTQELLSDLRVQNCVMLKGAADFDKQTNANKVFQGRFAACGNDAGDRWVITAWDHNDRTWGNAPCPCLHSDPKFPDCRPGQTQRITGWLSFYEGTDLQGELARIDELGWSSLADGAINAAVTEVRGIVVDAQNDAPLPARVTIRGDDGQWRLANSVEGHAVHYSKLKSNLPQSPEVHATLPAGPFVVGLPPGKYTIRIERGKEYLPVEEELVVSRQPIEREFRLKRWIDMADRGWYSGDVHVHRSLQELPNVVLAEDLNVALPVSHWAVDAAAAPTAVKTFDAVHNSPLIEVDPTHVIYPLNTEYEIFHIGGRQTALGALLVLNHRQPFDLAAPPLKPVAVAARQQGALLDLEKHSWPWSLMLVPVAEIDLFELANNHLWQTQFGLKEWTLNTTPSFMQVEQDADGFTERGWIDFGLQTYYALVNCGFRLRVSAGTASGVHPTPLGFGRVYVHCPEGFSYGRWIAGLDAGRSFVSTGPMLDVRFNDQPPGAAFAFREDEPASVRVAGTAESAVPLERVEVVVSGRVERVIEPANHPTPTGGYRSPLDLTISRDASYWVAVRCFEKSPTNRVRFAHTNPSYADVEGRPLAPRRAEVEYFIRRLEEEIENYRDVLSVEARDEFQRALDVYRKLAQTAQ